MDKTPGEFVLIGIIQYLNEEVASTGVNLIRDVIESGRVGNYIVASLLRMRSRASTTVEGWHRMSLVAI
jgi:hypothetical protein